MITEFKFLGELSLLMPIWCLKCYTYLSVVMYAVQIAVCLVFNAD